MRRSVTRKTSLAAALGWVITSGLSLPGAAQPNPSPENDGWDGVFVEPYPPAAPGEPYNFTQPETPLVAPDSTLARSPAWTSDTQRLPTPDFILNRIAEHADFVQPFLVPAVFPEFSLRLIGDGGYAPRNDAAEIDQLAYISFYYFDLYAPLLTLRDSSPTSTDHFRIDAKVPITFGHHALTLFIGGNIPTSGVWTNGGGFNTMLGYAFGSGPFSIQARAGFGYDQLITELEAPQTSSAMGDVAASFSLGPHASLVLEADGRKLLGQRGGTLRFWPGFRFFPLAVQTLSFAVGAQWWLDSFDATGQYINDFGTRRIGAYADFGYVFF